MSLEADLIESRVSGALRYQARHPDEATTHGLSAALLRPLAEYFRNGGTIAGAEHSLTVVRVALSDLTKGLHIPDAEIEGKSIPYNDPGDKA